MKEKLKYWLLFFVKGKRLALDYAIDQQKLSLKQKNKMWLYWNERITDDLERKHYFMVVLFIGLAYVNWLLIINGLK